MSRIPSLAKFTTQNNFIPQNFSIPRDPNAGYDDGLVNGACAPYTGIATIKINSINRKDLTLYFDINDKGNGWPQLFYSIDSIGNYPLGIYGEYTTNVDSLDFYALQSGDNLTVPYGSKLSLAPVGRNCDDFDATVTIYTYSGSTPSAQFLLDSFPIYDGAI